ncbi:filamentous hemagglutinin N-terminal domain-containing protein [Sphingomonas sp. MMS24-J13]|uniref:two-partner secretion domain-containing protein n=1 Tax=Sphingomonas sp. MMS24-J13 TaxID=3238686 RepID=UPI0038512DDA
MTHMFQSRAPSNRLAERRTRGRRSSLRGSTGLAGMARLAVLSALGSMAFGSAAIAQGLPTGGNVSAGAASIAGNGATLTINQSSQSAAINWQSFDIAAGKSVVFVQPNANAVALNRVIGPDPSVILGNLSANGKVFLVNPNGVLFGQSAQVNVGGLVASTLRISDADFMAGHYSFSGEAGGSVVNQGAIRADGGYVALLGANVSNEGVIQARLGTVILAAGEAVTLDMAGDGLLGVAIDRGAVNALVRNGGLIRADGGTVMMTAHAAGQLLHSVVNNSGIIEARTLEGRGGSISLLADMESGTTNVSGTLDASAPNGGDGGFIETSGATVTIADGAAITTAARAGRTGRWLIDPQDFTIAPIGGNISGATLSALLVTNSVTISTLPGSDATVAGTPPVTSLHTAVVGNGDILVNDAVAWVAAPNTTTLTLNAVRDINVNAPISATNGNVVLCCGRDVNLNAAITTVNGSVLVGAGHNINLATMAAVTTTDGNITFCAGDDILVAGALTLTRGTTIPAQSLGLPVGLVFIAGTSGTGPGIAGGTVIFAPLAPPITVTGPAAPVSLNYNPVSYAAPTDFSGNFTLTNGAVLTQHMLVFPNADKVFDGTANAVLAGFNSTAISGLPTGVTLIAGPGATAVFDDPAISGGTGVTFSGYSLGGSDASRYALAGGSCCVATFRTTGIIAAPPVTVPPVVVPPVVTPPVVVPPVETPPVVVPPVEVPPVVTPPVETPPVVVPPVEAPPVVVPPVETPPVVTPPVEVPPVVVPPVQAPPVVVTPIVTPPVVTPPIEMPPVILQVAEVVGPSGATLIRQNANVPVGPAFAGGIQLAMIGQGVRMPAETPLQAVTMAPRETLTQVQEIPAPRPPVVALPAYRPKQDRH